MRAPSLGPYLPRIVVDWLREEPGRTHRRVDGSVVFADISGFTALTERLARRGKAGAEDMRDILDTVFEQLLEAAYAHGGGLVKWGGDAVLLLFEGPGHAQAAACAAWGMQRRLRRVGRCSTGGAAVTLRMSVGVHSGPVDLYLVGGRHRELVVTGDAVSAVLAAEQAAAAGETVVTPATAELLAPRDASFGAARGGGVLLRAVRAVPTRPPTVVRTDGLDLTRTLSPALVEHLSAGPVESEHRRVVVAFLRFSTGAAGGAEELARRLAALVDVTDEVAVAYGVTFLATDVDTGGGKLILLAGAPAGGGDDETRMLGAVRAILDAAGPRTGLPLCAGVAAGRVFAGDFGPAHRRTYTVFGDCVNLAARLMAVAGPGELVTTPAVLAVARTRFATSPLPPLTLKGKSRPVTAVRVGQAVPGGDVPGERAPLVGRDAELALLGRELDSARAGRGRVVEIVGEAGLGRTSLLAAFLTAVPDLRVLTARGAVYDAAVPYRSLRELLHDLLGSDACGSGVELAAAVHRVAPALTPWTPLIGVAVGVEVPETAEVACLDRRFRKARLETAVIELLAAAAPGPAVLVVEDLHLFDEASADVVRRVACAAADRAWLVLGTRRTAVAADPPPLAVGATRLVLAPLDRAAAAELLHILTADAPLTPHVQDAILARAAGNPLFLRELGLRDAAVDALPDSIEGLIAERIDRLAPPDRSLLRATAVLGMRVDAELLAELLGPDTPDGAEVAARLDGFVTLDESGLLRFGRQLVRDTAYEGLAYRRRATLHRRAGDALVRRAGPHVEQVADLVAVHYAASRHWSATWHFARIAGRRARCGYALAEAEAAYALAATAAEQLTVADGDLREVFEALGDVRYDLGDSDGTDAAYRAARDRARADATATARLRLKTARVRERAGRYPQALWWISRGRSGLATAAPDAPAAALRARLDARAARIRHIQGRHSDAVRWAESALAAAQRCGDRRTAADALEVLDWADVALGRLDAPPHAVRALVIYTEIGDVGACAHIRNGLGARAFFRGRWTEAADHYRRARADWDRVGDVSNAATASANLAEVLVEQNRLVEAEESLRAAMRVWQAVGASSDIAWGRLQLGRVAARSGRPGVARELFRSARAHFAAHHEASELLAVDAAAAECDARVGRADEALAVADDALRRARSIGGLAAPLPALHRARGVALLHRHDRPGARAALRASLAAARARQALHDVALALTALLEHDLAGGDAAGWSAERDRLVVELGIRDVGGCPGA